MRIEPVRQQPVGFLGYEGQVEFDSSTGEIVIKPALFRLFEHEIELEEQRFLMNLGDCLYITDQGLVLVQGQSEPDWSQFQRFDLFGWVEKDRTGELVFKYIIHPVIEQPGSF